MRDLLFETIPNLTDEQCDKFVAYFDLLIDWNARMNLTAITEPKDVAKKHFYDSLAALPYQQTARASRTSAPARAFLRSRCSL